MKTIYKSIVPIVLVSLLTSLLLTASSRAQSETSYIIVHALNPEGIEIASIEGMDPNCVQIYDGGILIGYGAHDSATYNKPITISSGAHTIKVEFNGMTLEQNINPDSWETKILVFTFERTEFDIASWINGWGVEGEVSIKGSAHMDQYTPYVYDVETKHLASNGKLGVLFHVMLDLEDSTSYSEVSWNNTAKVKLTACSFYEYGHYSFSCSGNAIVHGVSEAYYYAWGHESTDNFASPTSEFESWFVQSIQNGYYPEISVQYTTGGDDTTHDTTTIASNSDHALLFGYHGLLPYYNHYRITPIQANVGYTDFSIHAGYWLGGDSLYVQDYCEDSTLEYTGSLIAKMSSVPYNLTGTGIEVKLVPVVLVHGWNGSNSSWGNLKSLLEGEGMVVKYFSFESSNWNIPIETLADQLNNALIAWSDELQIDELGVDIIAHSMGGLIARYYIAHDGFAFANKVKKLITLGTPHYGAAIAGWSDLLPFTIQGTQQKYASKFLWDLHQAWETGSIGTNVLCIAGARSYADPHDGFVRLPSASLQHLGYPVYYIPNPHTGQEGMAYILDENHPSFMAIKPFLSGETLPSNVPAINELNEHNLTDGFLIAGLFAPAGAPVKIRNNFWGFPAVEWKPDPTLYCCYPINWGVNRDEEGDDYAGKYFATGADPGSYTIIIYPEKGYSPVSYPVTIYPRQTTVLSIPVAPAEAFSARTAPAGSSEPLTFEGTGLTMQFESGPGGEIEVYLFTGDAPDTDSLTLPYYWEVISDLENGSFDAVATFEYSDQDLAGAGLSEDQLLVARYDSVWHPLATDIDTVVNVLQVHTSQFSLFGIGNFMTIPDTSTISGYVVVDSTGLGGVPIDLYDNIGNAIASTATDETGWYQFAGLDNGDYSVSISTPLGYQPEEETKQIQVRGLPHEVNFELIQLDIAPQQRSRGYWAHQLHKALQNKPKDYTLEDFSNFVGLINVHFNQNQINPVDFYSVPQPASQSDSLNVLKRLLHMRNMGEWEPFLKRMAKSQLMALMLNVVSGKVSQTHEISADGRTVSQLITYCDMLVSDEIDPPDNNGCPGHGSPWFRYIYASFMLVKANLGLTVPAGMIPEDVVQIAYKLHEEENLPTEFALHQNYPNPFNPTTEISFSLPSASHVKLEVFNVMGQKVTTLVDGRLEAGEHIVPWDGSKAASGVYLYRLQADNFVDTKKMILLK